MTKFKLAPETPVWFWSQKNVVGGGHGYEAITTNFRACIGDVATCLLDTVPVYSKDGWFSGSS